MKKCILSAIAGAVAMLVFLIVIANIRAEKERKPKGYEHIDYVSEITQENCFVCGSSTELPMSLHWGEDNVGIVNLDTFEALYLEINRYGLNGELIEEVAGYMQSAGMSNEDSYVHGWTYPDKGYASIQISNVNYDIDRDTIQSHLCQTCLDSINDMWFDEDPTAEYAILNFEDRTIRPLVTCTTWFGSGNYGVDCEFKEDGDIDLLIYYCPNRYKKGES